MRDKKLSIPVYLKRMHEVRRMMATLSEIFISKLCSIKSLVYASMVARAFHRVAGNIVHFKYS